MTRKDPALTVLQISDTHLHAAADSRMRGVTTYATFLAVLEHAQRDPRWPVDAILATGDIVQDESRAGYERFRAALEPLGVPVYSIPGNHDDPKLMGEILASGSFQLGGELRHGSWSVVLLSTFLAGEDAGGLGPARLPGPAQSTRGACGPAHPRRDASSPAADGQHVARRRRSARRARRSGASSTRITEVRGVVCGHVHQAADRTRNGVRFLSTPSTCAQFLPGNEFFALDDRPPGMRWIELYDDGRIETEVAWVPGATRT